MTPARLPPPEVRTKRGDLLINGSLARSGQQTNTELNLDPRVLGGKRLFRKRAEAFLHKRGAWFVPSENGVGYYCVRLGPVEVCECVDFEHRGVPCKHIHAASIAHAKSVVCDCCGRRVLGRFVSDVEEDDNLLAWYPGQRICSDCIRAGYWS